MDQYPTLKVISESDKNLIYTITITGYKDGQLQAQCNCKGYTYRDKCKHIKPLMINNHQPIWYLNGGDKVMPVTIHYTCKDDPNGNSRGCYVTYDHGGLIAVYDQQGNGAQAITQASHRNIVDTVRIPVSIYRDYIKHCAPLGISDKDLDSRPNTRVIRKDNNISCVYYLTEIARIDTLDKVTDEGVASILMLNTDKWTTKSTKERINLAMREWGLPFHITGGRNGLHIASTISAYSRSWDGSVILIHLAGDDRVIKVVTAV